MVFESVEWRKTFLWTLEVDDLLKANMDYLKKLFNLIKRGSVSKVILFRDTVEYIAQHPIEVSHDQITLAFAFSKMQFIDELELIDLYEQMYFVEFLEFLGRLAYLIWDSRGENLDTKLWRLLQILFAKIKEKVKEPQVELDIDSESDYEDEIATEIMLSKHPREIYAGFGVMKNLQKDKTDEDGEKSFQGKHYVANPWAMSKIYPSI